MGKAATYSRRAALLLGGAAVGYGLGRAWAPGLSQLEGVPPLDQAQGTILNDASQLSATPIHIHTRPTSHGDALVEAFRKELKAAQSEGRPVNVGAARHSMGGRRSHGAATRSPWTMPGSRWTAPIAATAPMGARDGPM